MGDAMKPSEWLREAERCFAAGDQVMGARCLAAKAAHEFATKLKRRNMLEQMRAKKKISAKTPTG